MPEAKKTTDKTQSKSVRSVNTASGKKEETIFPPYTDTNAEEKA